MKAAAAAAAAAAVEMGLLARMDLAFASSGQLPGVAELPRVAKKMSRVARPRPCEARRLPGE